MKTIYFVRHGQTDENVRRAHQGPDGRLTDVGLKQSAFIAQRVATLPVGALISSTHMRTRQTAELIAEKIGKESEYSELFVEGRGPSEFWGVAQDDPASAAAYDTIRANYGPGYHFSDEEGYDEHTKRAKEALAFLQARSEDHILVVTHGFFLRVMLAHVIFDMEPSPKDIQHITRHMEMQNTGLTIFEYNEAKPDPWRLWVWNDHAHLAD